MSIEKGVSVGPACRCLWCGYILAHLPENRCPECGNEFDPDHPKDVVVVANRIGFVDVLRHLVRGIPILPRLSRIEWVSLVTPAFPLAFLVIAAAASASVAMIHDMHYNTRYRITTLELPSHFIWALLNHCFLGFLGIMWIWFLVAFALKGAGASEKLAKHGASRVTYYSAAFLPFTKTSSTMFIRYSQDWPPAIYNTLLCCYLMFAVVRLLYLFRGMRLEPTGRTIPVLVAVLLSPDAVSLIIILAVQFT